MGVDAQAITARTTPSLPAQLAPYRRTARMPATKSRPLRKDKCESEREALIDFGLLNSVPGRTGGLGARCANARRRAEGWLPRGRDTLRLDFQLRRNFGWNSVPGYPVRLSPFGVEPFRRN